MYEYLDTVLKKSVKDIYRVFRQYRKMSFDELNIIGDVREMYEKLDSINKSAYRKIANHYYREENQNGSGLTEMWLTDFLREPNATMRFEYATEVYRKRDRLVEALIATQGLVTEYDVAMRYWVRQTGWFAVEVADAAIMTARLERGITMVRWNSESDNRVCVKCSTLDGKIFSLAKLPKKPHPNCRCWTTVVR